MNRTEIVDGVTTYTMHQSFLNTFSHCPEQARALWGKDRDDTHTDSTALGTAMHSAIEWALTEKRDVGVPALDEMLDVCQHELHLMHPWTRTKYTDAKVAALAADCCLQWYEWVMPEVDPLHVEFAFRKPLTFHLDGNPETSWAIFLEGAIDCVDVDGVPWDWKSASRPYDQWEYQRWAVQPSVYCYALDEPTFMYAVMAHGCLPQVFPVWRNQGHTDWLVKQARTVVSLLRSGLSTWPLIDTGWWCSPKWCDQFAECKGQYVDDDWQDSHAKREKNERVSE